MGNALDHIIKDKSDSKVLLALSFVITSLSFTALASEGYLYGDSNKAPVNTFIDNTARGVILKRPLFRSRFYLNEDKNIDLSIFDSCPSLKQTTETSRFSPQSRKIDEGANVIITADGVPENGEQRTRILGNVTMISEDSVLKADEIITDNISHFITANGNVSVETDSSLLRADGFEADQTNQSSKLTQVKFHFFANNGNGDAESITFDENNVARLNELTFSTCPTGDNSWRFSANQLVLDQESGWGEAWGMWLKVKGIPVFYFPYLNFPIDGQRKSGVLMPEVSNGGRNGLDVSVPIYWNIAPQFDATFIPRKIENRGNQLASEFRFLGQNSQTELNFAWLSDDRLTDQLLAQDPSLAEGLYGLRNDRWAISFNNKTFLNENWSASVSASKVSDRDYFRDLGTRQISPQGTNSQSQLVSQTNLTYQDDIWLVSLLAESTQSLVGDEPYRILPSLISNADYYHLASGLHWQLDAEYTRFGHSDKSLVDGSRVNIKPSLSYPLKNTYAWLTPKLSYQFTRYLQDDLVTKKTESISRDLPIFSLDAGLFFDRPTSWNSESVTHSFEPRVFYAYIPNKEQFEINNFDSRAPEFAFSQLWQANRFSGIDRIGDTNHVAVAFTNRFVKDKTGEQLLEISVGRKLYFEDRQVQFQQTSQLETSRYSPWLIEMSYNANRYFEFSGFMEWGDENRAFNSTNGINLARSQIKFEPMPDHIVNLSHRVRNSNGFSNEEFDFSFAWPINDEWRVVGRWYNDIRLNRTSETLFGFEYESCCWAVSIVSRRYLDVRLDASGNPISEGLLSGNNEVFNNGVQLQFVFKGLGSPGQKSVSQLLKNSIRGYSTRF